MTELINGIPVNPEALSDEEVMTLLDSTTERLYRTECETLKIIGWAALRGLVSNRPEGDVPDNVILFPRTEEIELRLRRDNYEEQ